MDFCSQCGGRLESGEGRQRQGGLWCDDCYLKAVSPKVMPLHQNDSSEFLRRLKSSDPARRQQFD